MSNWLAEMTFLTNRHGYSAGQNDAYNYIKFGDFPLPLFAPLGFEQAKIMGTIQNKFLQENPAPEGIAIISSSHKRALQTTNTARPQIFAAPVSIVLVRDYLGEHRYGSINGAPKDEISLQFPEYSTQLNQAVQSGTRHLLAIPGKDSDGVDGESQYDVHRRTRFILEDAKDLYDRGIRTIIISAHGTSGRAAQMNILGLKSDDATWKQWHKPNNCQIDMIKNGKLQTIFEGFPEPQEIRPSLRPALISSNFGNGQS